MSSFCTQGWRVRSSYPTCPRSPASSERALERALEVAGTDGTYPGVDIDALDGAYAPGTKVPGTAGLASREMLALVRGVAQPRRDGPGPTLDPANVTTSVAERVVLDALAFHARSGR